MRKYILVLTAISFLPGIVCARNKISLAFNMNECANCYNNLRHLDAVDPGIRLEFIFKKQYQPDSAYIVRNLYLDNYNASYIWSDSLNEAMLINKTFSSVTVSNSTRERSYQFSLKNSFNADVAQYINRLVRPVDTITLSENVLSSGVKSLVYRDNYVFVNDEFRNRISRVNLINGSIDWVIEMSDSLAQTAFKKKFRDPGIWATTQALVQKYRVAHPLRFEEITIARDGRLFALAEYAHFLITNGDKDTAKVPFFVLHQFSPKGILEQTSMIDQIIEPEAEYARKFFNNEIRDTILYFYATTSIAVKDKVLSLDMTFFPAQGYKKGKKYFRGNFEQQVEGNYKFRDFYEKELPVVYKEYGNNFTNIIYSYNSSYFGLPLSDIIYSVDDPLKEIHLGIFTGEQFTGMPFNFNYMMNQVNVEKHNAYAFYWLSQEKQSRLLKYDVAKGVALEDAPINVDNIPEEFVRLMRMDYFDYNFVVVPIAANKLLRFKVLKD